MTRKVALAAAFVVLLGTAVLVPTAAGSATVIGEPRLDVHLPSPHVQPGQTAEIHIQITNQGRMTSGDPDLRELVTTARNVIVEIDADDTPLDVRTGTLAVGSITENQPASATLEIRIPDGIPPGEYDIDVTLRYSHTSQFFPNAGVMQDVTRTRTRTITVVVDETADFAFTSVTSDVQIGASGTLTATLTNTGTERAEDIHVTLHSQSSRVVFGTQPTETLHAGTLDPGETTTIHPDVDVLPGARVRNYAIDATVHYTDADGIRLENDGHSIGFRPLPQQEFRITDIESTLQVGEKGNLIGNVTNLGPTPAQNVVIQFADDNPTLEPIEPKVAVGSLDPGETAPFVLPIRTSPDAEPIDRTVDLAVVYQDADNDKRLVDSFPMPSVTVHPEQSFRLDSVESTLRVGEEGELTGTITNEGPLPVRNAVVVFVHDSPNVIPIEREIGIGSLEPGDTASFAFPVELTREARATSTVIDLDIRYRTPENEARLHQDLDTTVDINERRDEFRLSVHDPTIHAGSSSLLTIEVTNNLDQPITDIEGRLFTDTPFSSTDDESYIPALEPGETAVITFDLAATGGATPKTYPVRLDFRYDDERGTSQLSETYRVAVHVTEPDETRFSWPLVGVIAGALALAGAWYYRRTQ